MHTNKCMYSATTATSLPCADLLLASQACRRSQVVFARSLFCCFACALALFVTCFLSALFVRVCVCKFSLHPEKCSNTVYVCVCVSLDYVTHSQCSKRRIYSCVCVRALRQRSQQKPRELLNYLLFPVIYCFLCVRVCALFLFNVVTSQRGRRRVN